MAKAECPIEDVECQLFHEWLEERGIPHTHIPNESRSGKKDAYIRGRKLKSMGVSSGYWDYDVYIPIRDIDGEIGGYELIKIEMKRQKRSLSKVTDDQKKWRDIYAAAGIPNYICYGAEQAKNAVSIIYEEINHEELREPEPKPIDF